MAKNLVTVSLDQLQENGFDAEDPAGSAETQYLDQTVLLAEGVDAVQFHIDMKENHVTDTSTTYDSGLADPEASLADHIEVAGGVEALVSQMSAAISAQQDRATESFDPILDGYSPVEPVVEALAAAQGLEFGEAMDNFRQLALPTWFGEKNPNYITQLWLDENGPEWTDSKGQDRKSPSRILVATWLAGKTPTVILFEDADLFREESDFADWQPVCMRTFRSAADARRHVRSQRPGFRPEDVKRQREQLASVRAELGAILPEPVLDDPADSDNF